MQLGKAVNEMNLQDSFLNQARTQKVPVNVYLMHGFQLKGVITGFDNFIIMLDTGGKQSLVYKHAVSTISPLKPIQFFKDGKNMDMMDAQTPPSSFEE